MYLTFVCTGFDCTGKVAVSNRKHTITLVELHFTSYLSGSNQPGTFKLTNHSCKFNARSFLLTFPSSLDVVMRKVPSAD